MTSRMSAPRFRAALLRLILPLAVAFTGVGAAEAQKIELAGRVTASRTVLGQRRVGAPRYVALSDLFYRDKSAIVEVLDLQTQAVIQVRTKRAYLERKYGMSRDGGVALPQAEVVSYRDGVVGLAIAEPSTGGPRRYWYVELDAATGKPRRSADLAMLDDGNRIDVVGADPTGAEAWFAITEISGRKKQIVLRRLDLASLAVHDEQRISLAARGRNGNDHAVRVHAAPDFSQFAIVEYVENDVGMAPGKVYIVDPASGAAFSVPAPPTAYGVAFAADNRYVYLGSAQLGTISRIDVAAQRIDKQVAGPRYLHHLVIPPGGTKLFVFASSSKYAVYDLPDLKTRSDASHPAGVAAAMAELHGNGVASLDGAYFIVPEAERPRATGDRGYVIARLID